MLLRTPDKMPCGEFGIRRCRKWEENVRPAFAYESKLTEMFRW